MDKKNSASHMAEKEDVASVSFTEEVSKRTPLRRFADSFKPHPGRNVFTQHGAGHGYDMHEAAEETAESPLARTLKGRHLQMIAIGGAIGTGLFVGSGSSLATGGPANLLIAFFLTGIMLFCTVHALGEMAVLFPVSGSYSVYATRFVDPAWGFAMSWNYCVGWFINLPLELVAASITIQYWNPGVSNAVFVTIFLICIIIINLFGARGYGEVEFVLSMVKVLAVLGFIIVGIVINVGGGPSHEYIGGKYWHDPGAFNNGFKGLCSVFVTAAFSFSGTELAGLAAAETENPRRTLPRATKQVFWRILIFYMVSLTVVGLIVPFTDPRLLNGESSVDIKSSPFVIAITSAGIKVLPSIMNVVILLAVLSVGNSSMYGSTRVLCSLAEQGQAPRIFAYVDRKGRPLAAVAVGLTIGLLSYLAVLDDYSTVFNWLLSVSGLSGIFAWLSINFCHIRFRRAWKVQGYTLDQLPFKSAVGVIGSWLGFIFNALVLVAQFWVALFPIGGSPSAADFFQAYLAAPICIACYIVFKIVKRTSFVSASEMDLLTGRRYLMSPEDWEEERLEQANWSKMKKFYRFWC